MTPAERRRVARVLREAARYTAQSRKCPGMVTAILRFTRTLDGPAWRAVNVVLGHNWMPLNEEHRSVRVIALLLTAEAVLIGDCE